MKPKILITIEGGMISSIGANMPIEILINDYDNQEDDQIYEYKPDAIFTNGEAHKLITAEGGSPLSMAENLLKSHLKDVKF